MSPVAYYLHHLCIYDGDPRANVWTWLRWYHAVAQYYWGGEEFHLTDQGHVDYTFLACGSPFQVQLESPPYQFEYERIWHDRHGSGINHICWIVEDAKVAFDHLAANGCEFAQEYTEFGVYNGFVAEDPEGRWIEVMEYVGDFKTPDVECCPFGVPGLQLFGVTQFTEHVAEMSVWYQRVMGLKVLHGSVEAGTLFLADGAYDRDSHNIALILSEPSSAFERSEFAKHGPVIGGIDYQATELERAYTDAGAAGFELLVPPTRDDRTGLATAVLREPSLNLVYLREMFRPGR